MDGFHLDNAILLQDGRIDFKGAPDTFDVPGFLSMHHRLAENRDTYVAVPVFDRGEELSRASARRIDRSVEIVLVEGNYLLLREPGWESLKRFYDLTIRIDVPEQELTERLIERWTEQKLSRDHIREKVFENDLPNGRTVVENSALPDIVYAPVSAGRS